MLTASVRQRRFVQARRFIFQFVAARLFGWFMVAALSFLLCSVWITNYLSAEIDKHYIITPR